MQRKSPEVVELCSRCQTECSCSCCAVHHVHRPADVYGRVGRVSPPPPIQTQSPTLNRRQTVSSPATTVLPACGICRKLPYSSNPAASVSESSIEASAEEPRSLAVEVDSHQFVDVAVGPDRPLEPVRSVSDHWPSGRNRQTRQVAGESEPQWRSINKLRFCLTTHNIVVITFIIIFIFLKKRVFIDFFIFPKFCVIPLIHRNF